MQISQEGLKLIKAWEGIEDGDPSTVLLEPYICPAHVYTVGWGHALKTQSGALIDVDVFGAAKSAKLAADSMDRLFSEQAISREQAEQLLLEDADRWSATLCQHIGAGNATQNQFDALVSFAYNVGFGNFDVSAVKRFHMAGNRKVGDISLSTLCRASKNKEQPTTMAIAFGRFATANNKWMLGLYRRRISEMMIYGGHDYDISVTTAKGFQGC